MRAYLSNPSSSLVFFFEILQSTGLVVIKAHICRCLFDGTPEEGSNPKLPIPKISTLKLLNPGQF
jgi:hypothetical protein